jgi:hypothetical protein
VVHLDERRPFVLVQLDDRRPAFSQVFITYCSDPIVAHPNQVFSLAPSCPTLPTPPGGGLLPPRCSASRHGRLAANRSSGRYLAAMPKRPAKPSEPPPPLTWTILYAASKARWLGTVDAADEAAAIEKAVVEFRAPSKKLIATRQRL